MFFCFVFVVLHVKHFALHHGAWTMLHKYILTYWLRLLCYFAQFIIRKWWQALESVRLYQSHGPKMQIRNQYTCEFSDKCVSVCLSISSVYTKQEVCFKQQCITVLSDAAPASVNHSSIHFYILPTAQLPGLLRIHILYAQWCPSFFFFLRSALSPSIFYSYLISLCFLSLFRHHEWRLDVGESQTDRCL